MRLGSGLNELVNKLHFGVNLVSPKNGQLVHVHKHRCQ